VLRSPRWDKIVAGFRDANAAMLLFAPLDAPDLAALGRFAGETILLGSPAAGQAAAAAFPGVRLRAWLTEPRRDQAPAPAAAPRAAAPAAPADRFPDPEPVMPWNAPAGSIPVPPPAPLPADPAYTLPAETVAPRDIPAPEPDWEEKPAASTRRRGVSPVLLALLLLALLIAAVALLAPRLGLALPFLGGAEPDPVAPSTTPATVRPAARGPARQEGVALPYSVFVGNYQTAEAAETEAASVARRFPEAQLFVFPELKDGVTYWRIMAGMVADTAEVLALRDRLLAAKVMDADEVGGPWDLIQKRPITYDVGDYADAAQARERAAGLSRQGIPAYVAPVPFSDGTERWKVYAGAYRDTASARPMGAMLEKARVPVKIVERTGRPPASPK
ncbi:MAG TPA: SPOR domain-containing protein, partial [Longimicrobium sp.]|uniref:SPOR domain-containing protein n=1 Tax=Longimicrobium sp. TaxID=2029185 RepID=UPI002EDABCBC